MAMTIPGWRLGGRLSKTAKILRKHGAESNCHSQGQGELHIAVAVRRMKGLSPWGSLALRVATLAWQRAARKLPSLWSLAIPSFPAHDPDIGRAVHILLAPAVMHSSRTVELSVQSPICMAVGVGAQSLRDKNRRGHGFIQPDEAI
ncbi:hypothetical protein MRS44_006410 [Fusarium solani]|uniref:uncharacterized protein n=1 Tax=Fusarium solani TaxID=169388 RepID=UPI0032C44775|nr:hypothetical protein MRS44_006410 [Fusarium solani]